MAEQLLERAVWYAQTAVPCCKLPGYIVPEYSLAGVPNVTHYPTRGSDGDLRVYYSVGCVFSASQSPAGCSACLA